MLVMLRQKTLLALLVVTIAAFTVLLPGCTCEDAENDGNTTQQQSQLIKDLTVSEFYNLIRQNEGDSDFVILDVRTAAEYDKGHIADAVLIDYRSATFKEELDVLDKDKTYLVYCRSGNRGGQATDIMEDLGFSTVYNMLGGINDWIEAAHPVA